MSQEKLQEAHARVVEWQAAFIQGVAASAIAFAIHETADRMPAWSLIPIAAGMLCWSASFMCGIGNNHARQKAIAANIADLVALQAQNSELAATALSRFKAATKSAGRFYIAQLWLLLAGALLYVGGHGMHIFENAASSKPAATSSR